MATVAQIEKVLKEIAPLSLAEPWDKVGLQLGNPRSPVRRAMLCIDLTPAVVREAVASRVRMVVTYHPLIFEPLATLRESDRPGEWKQRAIAELVRRRIAVYSPHTTLDAVAGGLNDWLAAGVIGDAKAGVISVRAIKPHAVRRVKFVAFVPTSHADQVRDSISQAGAGSLGDYDSCSFNVDGEGTFRPLAGAKPFIGSRGKLERVKEVRIEMLCETARVSAVVSAMRKSHPYEEPAFDIYPLETSSDESQRSASRGETAGQGRIIRFDLPISLATLIQRLKRRLGVRSLEVASPATNTSSHKVRTIGFCAGAGGSLLKDCPPDLDAFVTGEMRHHDVLDATQRGITILLAGHTQTERPYLPTLRRRLERATGAAVTWIVSRADHAPSSIV